MARRRVVGALVTVAVLVTSCQTPSDASRPVALGMCVHMIFTDPAEVVRQFDLMARMHVQMVRVDFDWSGIEGERGHYDWSYPDRMMDEAQKRGMQLLALLTYTPRWARAAGTTSHAPPERAADFADFAAAAARRYTGRPVAGWEIWNEPNSSDYWEPRPDVDRYGELFRAAATALRGAGDTAPVMTGGLTRGADIPDRRRLSQATFLEGLYRNGAARVADALAVHPYSFPRLPTVDAPEMPGGFAELPGLHALTQRHGDGSKKIWITEFGAPTGTNADAMSPEQQSTSLQQAQHLASTWEWAGPLLVYQLRDAGTDPGNLEDNFGVLDADLREKPAATALMN